MSVDIFHCYVPKNFKPKSLETIAQANDIITEFAEKGFDLTLRQLYYQFVARGLLGNNQRNYKNLGTLISDARLAGEIPWNRIVDRTRSLRTVSTWDDPSQIIWACANQFKVDLWEGQDFQLEVWIEKDALAGVFRKACNRRQIPFFSCRGYTSQSSIYEAAQRHIAYGKRVVVLHFGDHDPSGIDMTSDIKNRLRILGATDTYVSREALNMDQVEEFQPPPNPAKLTDSRANDYVANYGTDSWELDALTPEILADIVEVYWDTSIEHDQWEEDLKRQKEGRDQLEDAARKLEENDG